MAVNKIVFSDSSLKEIFVEDHGEGISINGRTKSVDFIALSKNLFHCILDDKAYTIELLDQTNGEVSLRINGKKVTAGFLTPLDQLLGSLGMTKKGASEINEIHAPMPGLILKVFANKGDKLIKGDPVLILEAMKMENVIKSPVEGEIKAVKVKEGQSVSKNQLLIEF